MRRSKRINQLKKGLSSLVILLALAVVSGGVWWSWADQPYSNQNTSEMIAITPGMTANQVGTELERRHLIRSARAFRLLASQLQADSKLIAGDYLLSADMSPKSMLTKLLSGTEVEAIRLTIPEGYTTDQIVNLLVQKGIGTKEEYAQVLATDGFDYSFLQGIPQDSHRLDGFLFPDTYFLDKKTTPHTAIDLLLQRFQKELTAEVQTQLQGMNLSIRDWVNLSSLVEKEAVQETDRPIIAGVLMNRLDRKMPLQVDATIQYILGTPKAKLYNKDLQIESPYNTYLHNGLPPGPIASPGHASLNAVLHPEKSDYLFYLAKSDGYHVFAKTFAEHLENQKKYS
ncbi:endolytic transglycosylase MltG [Desulfitobacterium metallireducens]|uniref:Endolytic murein transglycosylase n=1 Tax=Desulfitobacterium metallireducens DSM 15288 TaxID=871968 RepID=W0EE08_9FIRM|nr:endolytic transglycosylase MltG [Desulfitobacterium metallireducens]AHF07439.1 aminodeoxychorismate lyase [Desulfitobacterium metallireducens DSM 15288]